MSKVQYVCGEHMASYKCVTSFGRTAAILYSGNALNTKGTTVFDKLCVWNGLKKKKIKKKKKKKKKTLLRAEQGN